MKAWLVAAAGLGSALGCRSEPIPEGRRFPAGTPLTARYVTIDSTRIRYIDTGRGPAVVLIHGLAASMYSWRHTILPVAQSGFRVIAFDNRGFGFSDKPAHGYDNKAYVDLLFRLLDSLGVSEAFLVGHSMGGAIAAEATLDRPERVRGLVLVDAAGLAVRWPFMLRVAHWPIVGALFDRLRGRAATAGILKALYAVPSRVTAEEVDQYYAPIAEPGFGRCLRGVLGQFRFDALTNRLGRVAAPTLVMWGTADRLIPAAVGQSMADQIPGALMVRFPDAGHAVPEESPGAFNEALIGFLAHGPSLLPADIATAP
jgi:4,5:9,10-diseco-3-hydroxy-5,9,17-trioxoandrosta-1(10),2-diene-4-oate hydrolase